MLLGLAFGSQDFGHDFWAASSFSLLAVAHEGVHTLGRSRDSEGAVKWEAAGE